MFPFGNWQQIINFYPQLSNYSDHQIEWAAHELTALASLTYLQGSFVNFEKLRSHLLNKGENEWPAHVVTRQQLIQFAPTNNSTRLWDYFRQFYHDLDSLNEARKKYALDSLTEEQASKAGKLAVKVPSLSQVEEILGKIGTQSRNVSRESVPIDVDADD